MTSGQSPISEPPDSSPSYSNSTFLGIGVAIVLATLALALLFSVRASSWWLCAVMAAYALARLTLPESGKFEGLAVRSKFLDVSFLSAISLLFGFIALTAPNSM